MHDPYNNMQMYPQTRFVPDTWPILQTCRIYGIVWCMGNIETIACSKCKETT